MLQTSVNGPTAVNPSIVDAVKASLDNTYSAFFVDKPTVLNTDSGPAEIPCIAGIISFIGQENWSLSWIISKEAAPKLAKKFAGFDIPFESSDMGDMAGELINVLAGEIVAQLEQRKIKSAMSLPTVTRGSPLEFLPEAGPSIMHVAYKSREGPFWFRFVAAKHFGSRLSGG